MAIVANVTVAGSATDATTYATGSFTPIARHLLVVATESSTIISTAQTLTASANGLTFSQVTSITRAATETHILWVADQLVPSVPVAMTLTLGSGATATGGIVSVASVNGMSKAGTAAVRSFSEDIGASGTTPTAVLSNTPLTTNPCVVFVLNGSSPAGLTPPTSWTEAYDSFGHSSPNRGMATYSRDSGQTSATVTWGATTGSDWSSVGVELDATPALVFVGSSKKGNDTFANTSVIPTISGCAPDDEVDIGIPIWDDVTDTITITAPAGFAPITGATDARNGLTGEKFWTFRKRLTAVDTGSYTFEIRVGGVLKQKWNTGQAVCWRGVDPTSPVDFSNITYAAGYTAPPSIGGTATGADGITHFVSRENTGTSTPATGYTEAQEANVLTTSYKIGSGSGTETATGGTSSVTTNGHSVIVGLKPVSSSVTGSVSASIPKITGAVAGDSVNAGATSATLPKVTGAITGTATNTGTLTASLPVVTGSTAGQSVNTGSSSATLPAITGSIAGASANAGTTAGTLPVVTGSVAGASLNTGTTAGNLPAVTGAIADQAVVAGTVAGTLPAVTGSIAGTATNTGTTSGTLPVVTAALTGTATNAGALAANLPRVLGAVADTTISTGILTATLGPVIGTISGESVNAAILTATLAKIAGTGAGNSANLGTVAGILPLLVGTSTGDSLNTGAVDGVLPRVTGALTSALVHVIANPRRSANVPAEDRTTTVAAETRTTAVLAEDRSPAVPAEQRHTAVPADARTLTTV